MRYFEKSQISPSAGAPPPDPLASWGLGFCPRPPASGGLQRLEVPPQTLGLAPPWRIPDYAPDWMSGPKLRGVRGAKAPLATILPPEVFWIVIYFIIFSIMFASPNVRLPPLKIFLFHHSIMFSSCGCNLVEKGVHKMSDSTSQVTWLCSACCCLVLAL